MMKDALANLINSASASLVEYIYALDLSQCFHFLFGLGLCIISGWIIGNERESNDKPAGIKTHTLVLMGAMLFTIMSSVFVGDASPSRVAANIVTGIGFLGAGIILKRGANVENLTTAAGIWVSAAIGMAIGLQLYFIAIVTTIAVAIGLHIIPHPNKKDSSE